MRYGQAVHIFFHSKCSGPPHPDLARGYLPWGTPILTWPGGVPTMAEGYLPWGTPHPDLARGYLPWLMGTYLGVLPILTWLGGRLRGIYLGVPPILTWREGTYLGWGYLPWGTPVLTWVGVPTLAGRYLPWGTHSHPDLGRGVPQGRYPPGVDKKNKLKLLPSPILRMRAVNMNTTWERTHLKMCVKTP